MTRYVLSSQAKLKEAGGATAVYVRESRALHTLNSTAALLVHSLEEPLTLQQLVRLMSDLTDGTQPAIEEDLKEILPQLVSNGILTLVE